MYIEPSKKQKSGLPIYISLIAMLAILIGQPWQNSMLISIGTWTIIFSVTLSFLVSLSWKIKAKHLFLLLFLLCISLFSMLASGAISYRSIVAALCFIELPMGLFYTDDRVKTKVCKAVYLVFYALSFYHIYLRFTNLAFLYRTEENSVLIEGLTLGYPNPNQTGMFLMVTFFILASGICFFRSKLIKLLFLLNSLFIAYLILETSSRVCIILLIAFVLSFVFQKRIKIKPWLIKVSFISPIVFLAFIMFFESIYEGWSILGDSFETGRFGLYSEAFNAVGAKNYLFGNFAAISFQNTHNAYLSIFGTVGIVGLVVFVTFLYFKFRDISFLVKMNHQKIAYIGLLLLLVHSSVEAAFFTSGSVYAVLVISLSCLSVAGSSGGQ